MITLADALQAFALPGLDSPCPKAATGDFSQCLSQVQGSPLSAGVQGTAGQTAEALRALESVLHTLASLLQPLTFSLDTAAPAPLAASGAEPLGPSLPGAEQAQVSAQSTLASLLLQQVSGDDSQNLAGTLTLPTTAYQATEHDVSFQVRLTTGDEETDSGLALPEEPDLPTETAPEITLTAVQASLAALLVAQGNFPLGMTVPVPNQSATPAEVPEALPASGALPSLAVAATLSPERGLSTPPLTSNPGEATAPATLGTFQVPERSATFLAPPATGEPLAAASRTGAEPSTLHSAVAAAHVPETSAPHDASLAPAQRQAAQGEPQRVALSPDLSLSPGNEIPVPTLAVSAPTRGATLLPTPPPTLDTTIIPPERPAAALQPSIPVAPALTPSGVEPQPLVRPELTAPALTVPAPDSRAQAGTQPIGHQPTTPGDSSRQGTETPTLPTPLTTAAEAIPVPPQAIPALPPSGAAPQQPLAHTAGQGTETPALPTPLTTAAEAIPVPPQAIPALSPSRAAPQQPLAHTPEITPAVSAGTSMPSPLATESIPPVNGQVVPPPTDHLQPFAAPTPMPQAAEPMPPAPTLAMPASTAARLAPPDDPTGLPAELASSPTPTEALPVEALPRRPGPPQPLQASVAQALPLAAAVAPEAQPALQPERASLLPSPPEAQTEAQQTSEPARRPQDTPEPGADNALTLAPGIQEQRPFSGLSTTSARPEGPLQDASAGSSARTPDSRNVPQPWRLPGVSNTVLLHIDPPEFGPLLVHVRLQAKRLIASFQAESPDVEAILRANLPALQASLSQHGFEVQPIGLSLVPEGFGAALSNGAGNFSQQQQQQQQQSTFHVLTQEQQNQTDADQRRGEPESGRRFAEPRHANRRLIDVVI